MELCTLSGGWRPNTTCPPCRWAVEGLGEQRRELPGSELGVGNSGNSGDSGDSEAAVLTLFTHTVTAAAASATPSTPL